MRAAACPMTDLSCDSAAAASPAPPFNVDQEPGPFDREKTIPVFARWFGSWQVSVRRRAFSGAELTRRYDRSSGDWHRRVERLGFPAAYEAVLRRVVGREPPARVLDCGTGTGALALALANLMPGPFALSAVDRSARMLAEAGQVLRGTGASLSLIQADATTLPFADASFDLVMTAHMLEHLADPSEALGEMVRVLRPGGRLICCITRRSLPGMMIHLKWRTQGLTPEQSRRLLQRAGLRGVESLTFDRAPWCRRLSLACTGRKPL